MELDQLTQLDREVRKFSEYLSCLKASKEYKQRGGKIGNDLSDSYLKMSERIKKSIDFGNFNLMPILFHELSLEKINGNNT